jgi:hypothetical protein
MTVCSELEYVPDVGLCRCKTGFGFDRDNLTALPDQVIRATTKAYGSIAQDISRSFKAG